MKQGFIIAAALAAATSHVYAAGDPCATFFWTGSHNEAVARYQPRYLIGQGLEDVHMDQIAGTRIRYQWSKQAATCIASANPYGYFANAAFTTTACAPGDGCTGTRLRKMSERLADAKATLIALATPNSDATYQASLNLAHGALDPAIAALESPAKATARFLTGLAAEYDPVIARLDVVVAGTTPPSVRTAVFDELCSPDNQVHLEDLANQCFENGTYCDIDGVFNTLTYCRDYQSGAELTQMIQDLTDARDGLVGAQTALRLEHDAILSTWDSLQPYRVAPVPVDGCAIKYAFGTARLPVSDRASGHYGAAFPILYGDWDWTATFGLPNTVARTAFYVTDVARLVRDCVGDVRYGRLDFSRHQIADGSREETDAEYTDRAFNDLVDVRRELATLELNYNDLIHTHAPLVPPAPSPETDALKTIVSQTITRVLDLAADRTFGLGWILVNADQFQAAANQLAATHTLARTLITLYLDQYPDMLQSVIDMLVDPLTNALGDYGQFFSEARRQELEALIDDVLATGFEDDLSEVIIALSDDADLLQDAVQTMFDNGEPLRELANKLKLVFGTCDAAGNPGVQRLPAYFSDLPITARILEEGDDASVCTL